MCHSMWCKGSCTVSLICKILLIVGGLNWGLVGLGMLVGGDSDWNVVHMILGSVSTLEAIVYVLVGIAAAMKIFGCRCHKCMGGCDCGTSHVADGMDKKM